MQEKGRILTKKAEGTEINKKFVNIEREISEYKDFALSTNLITVAVSIILANSCQKLTNSIIENLLMPIINFFIYRSTLNWKELKITIMEGLDIEIGKITSSTIEFFVTTIVLYIIFYKLLKIIHPNVKVASK